MCLHPLCLNPTVHGTRMSVHFIRCLPSLTSPLTSSGSEPTAKDLFKGKILSFPLSPYLQDQAVDCLNMKYRGILFLSVCGKRGAGVEPLLNVCLLNLGFSMTCYIKEHNQYRERASSVSSRFVI